MNICIVTQRYPYKNNMEFVFVKKLVDEWAKMGHRCVVITDFSWTTYLRKRIEFKPKHYRDEVAPGVFVDVYNPRLITTKLLLGDFSLDLWLASNVIGRQISRLDIKFDFIYCHFFESALIAFRYAKKNNIPFFIATGESEIKALKKPYFGFEWDVFRQYIKGVVAVSRKNREEAASCGYIDVSKCRVFPNGTNTTLFKLLDKTECRRKLNLPLDPFIISCVGYICERKGQNRLLEAVRRIGDKDIKIMFVGSESKLETFTLEGDEIIFKGKIDNVDLPIYLNASDVFCLPTRAEGCCNAIIEALACGLPVISSDLSFNWDVLDESNSYLIDPDNVQDIGDAIKVLRINSAMRKKLSEGAFNKALGLNMQDRAQGILKYIMNII